MIARMHARRWGVRSAALLSWLLPAVAFGASPALHFSDLTWGPKSGWEGSASRGAAVTVWGENFGQQRSGSYVTVNGAALTADSDYAEWGVADARGLQRITFWLNPNCSDGAGSISVTVNGAASKTLPFTVAAGEIYFVSVKDGNNNNDGKYSSAKGGSNGPFRDLYMFSLNHHPLGDGQYIVYVRGGSYSTIDPIGDGAMIAYRGPSGGPSRQKALIGYPGETPAINGTAPSRGFVWNADYSPYGRNGYLTYSKLNIQGGTEAIYVFGDYVRVIGNHFQNMLDPAWTGVVYVSNSAHARIYGNWFDHNGAQVDGSYKHNLYMITETLSELATTQDGDVGWNEFNDFDSGSDNRGGSVFVRTDGSVAATRQTQQIYIHDNLFRGGNTNHLEIGDGPVQKDIYIYNNVFTGGPSVNSAISIRWTTFNANLFNNTIYLAGKASEPIVEVIGNSPGTSLRSANNIFYALPGQSFFGIDSGSTMTSDHDLFYRADGASLPSGSGLSLTNGKTGDPLFVNAAGGDFHLQSASPAVNAGVAASGVNEDYNGTPRPQGSAPDLGAFEFGSGSTPTPPPTAVTVAVSPTAISLNQGTTQQFMPTVTGSTNTTVTWSINPQVGSITSGGLYTAPSIISSQQTVQVTVTSAADPTKSASAIVTLTPPAAIVSVAVNPASATLTGAQTQQFAAKVTGSTNTSVTWSLNPQVGSISTSGLYTAPATISTQQTLQVIATPAADPTKATAATITLTQTAPPISVTVSPASVSLNGGQTQQFAATVAGSTNASVAWSLNPQVGSISSSGLYTAPSAISAQQTVQVTATSAADSTKRASAVVTLNPPAPAITVAINPGSVSLTGGKSQQFVAAVTGSTNASVAWSLNPQVGSISSSGLYTAPSTISAQQTVQVTATSAADSTKRASAVVTLNPPAPAVTVAINPGSVSLTGGKSQQFVAAVTGSTNVSVAWSLNPQVGSISSSGLYTAPASISAQQTIQVTATSAADSTKRASAAVTLNPTVVSASYSVNWQAVSATQVRVTWTAPAGHSQYDSVTLSGVSAAGWWYLSSKNTGSANSGSYLVTIPKASGVYQFRYNSNKIEAVSADLPVNVAQFSVTADTAAAAAGSQITVRYTAPSGRPKTWADKVALYRVGDTNDNEIWYEYTMGAVTGSFTLRLPTAPGTYELRYVMDYVYGAKSAPVLVK